ncbi:MAG TPA: class I SAM-dependent methyltransferase [Marmoricola sp.]|nr:class I SAM-dependent methyltransferase [Marmoricola sp.]
MTTDWQAWHGDYADPESALSRRLRVVQQHLDRWLDETAPGAVTVLSACAGDGRDLVGVLEGRPDAARVRGTLVETDPRSTAAARARIGRLSLALDVRETDAGVSDAYAGGAPADLVLLCGIFGNISDDDVARTIAFAPQLCRPGALVLWTRHRRAPDLTPRIRGWFTAAGFAEVGFTAPGDGLWSVGACRYDGPPTPLQAGQRIFTFVR